MKARLFLLATTLFVASTSQAQRAADPNAINIGPLSRVIDTAQNTNYINTPIPVGDVDGDGVEDVFINRVTVDDEGGSVSRSYLITKANSDPQKAPLQLPYQVLFAADLNDDGHKDIVTIETTNEGFFNRIHWWTDENGPFNAGFNTLLMENTLSTVYAQLAADVTGDGIDDIITRGNNKLYLYKGEKDLHATGGFRAFDSIDIDEGAMTYALNYMVGKLTPDNRASLVLTSSSWVDGGNWIAEYKMTMFTMGSEERPLGTATVRPVYLDTIPAQMVFVYTSPSMIADVTGDGLDDLIASDSAHLYIWKGGEGFGTTPLTEENADHVIFSPRLIDLEFENISSISQIEYLGNITGTGVPFFSLNAYGISGSSTAISTFIYAGGEAMDTRFDAYLPDTIAASPDLSTIKLADGSNAIIHAHYVAPGDWQVRYIREGLENIPQTKASVSEVDVPDNALRIDHVSPSAIRISSGAEAGVIVIYDLLGRAVVTRTLTSDSEVIDISNLSTGTYHVTLENNLGRRVGKFIR